MTKIQITRLRQNGEVSARYLQEDGSFIPDANPICAKYHRCFANRCSLVCAKQSICSVQVWCEF